MPTPRPRSRPRALAPRPTASAFLDWLCRATAAPLILLLILLICTTDDGSWTTILFKPSVLVTAAAISGLLGTARVLGRHGSTRRR